MLGTCCSVRPGTSYHSGRMQSRLWPVRTASIEGHIDISGIGEALVLAGADTLTLTIEDGRRMAFQLTSSGGGIIGRCWLP